MNGARAAAAGCPRARRRAGPRIPARSPGGGAGPRAARCRRSWASRPSVRPRSDAQLGRGQLELIGQGLEQGVAPDRSSRCDPGASSRSGSGTTVAQAAGSLSGSVTDRGVGVRGALVGVRVAAGGKGSRGGPCGSVAAIARAAGLVRPGVGGRVVGRDATPVAGAPWPASTDGVAPFEDSATPRPGAALRPGRSTGSSDDPRAAAARRTVSSGTPGDATCLGIGDAVASSSGRATRVGATGGVPEPWARGAPTRVGGSDVARRSATAGARPAAGRAVRSRPSAGADAARHRVRFGDGQVGVPACRDRCGLGRSVASGGR